MSTFVFAGLLALACIPVGAGLVFGYRLFVDWQDSRSYQPPLLHTDVWPAIQVPTPEVELPAPNASGVVSDPTEAVWALSALSDVRKAAAEDGWATLAEFARPVPNAPAVIWAEIHGRRHVQGLAIA